MAGEACNCATPNDVIQRMLEAKRIAVVGLSDDPSRPSYGVARYLQSVGKQIIPVNPRYRQTFGATCYAALEDIPGTIDLVNVFRRPEYCADVVRSAVAIKAGGVWLQSGIISEEARRIAESAGIDFVQDRCIMIENMRLAH